MVVLGVVHNTDDVTGGGTRCDGGELYCGSSWSRACGSSKDLRNFGGGESEPRTEFNSDMMGWHTAAVDDGERSGTGN